MKKKRIVFQFRTDEAFLKEVEKMAEDFAMSASAYIKSSVKMQMRIDRAKIRKLVRICG